MSLIKGNHAGLGGSGAPGGALGSFYSHTIGQSIRVERGDTGRLDISFSGDGDSQALGTFSWWMKRTELGRSQSNVWFEQSGYGGIQFRSDKLAVNSFDSSNTQVIVETDAVFRDPSSWYHFMVRVNGTAGTIQFYVNGVEQAQTVTNGSLASSRSWDFLNHDSRRDFYLFSNSNGGNGTSALFAEFHFLDGLSYDPSYFGETKDGVWVPKAYSGSHGTNGFYLPFDDSSAIGDDESANTNDFSANNLVASDVVPDSPTRNFATMNPLMVGGVNTQVHASAVYSEGNLKVACGGYSTSTIGGGFSTIAIPKDKKIYVEVCETNSTEFGAGVLIQDHVQNNTQMSGNGSVTYYNRSVIVNGTETDYGSSAGAGGLGVARLAAGDVLGIAIDGATGKVWFHRNGTYFKSPSTNNSGTTGNPSAGSNEIGTVTNTTAINPSGNLFFFLTGNSSTDNLFINFGQDSTFAGNKDVGSETDANGEGLFLYAVPTDYVCLHSGNMSDPAIGPAQSSQSDDYFNTVLYTGNGSTQSITGAGFQPDWVWLKARGFASGHALFDSVRGATEYLASETTTAESTLSDTLTSFDSDGFSLGANNGTNRNSTTFVSWNWKAGGAPSGDNSAANDAEPTAGSAKIDGSNQSGAFSGSPSIAIKRLSASTAAGISIVRWTGTGSAGTIPHGLGAAPDFYVVKNITDDGTSWQAYHRAIASDAETDYIYLNSTADADDSDDWNDTAPTDNVFSVKSHNQVNATGDEYIAYLFTSIEGFSKHSSYVGNGNANGTFVYTGFRPAWIMMKVAVVGSSNWFILDSTRSAINEADDRLNADTTGAESTSNSDIDFLSNGFKIRTASTSGINQNTDKHIYLAFAEAPFKFANAR